MTDGNTIIVAMVVGAVIAYFFLDFIYGKIWRDGMVSKLPEEPQNEDDDEWTGPVPELSGELKEIPSLSIVAGPRDGAKWQSRVKQELASLVKYIEITKKSDSLWFSIQPLNKECTKWQGTCWQIHNLVKYEFDVEFEIPVTYPKTPFEIVIKELDGKTVKMYRGGKICLSAHFKPLWAKNVPRFGIAHALSSGLAPWLAAEVPHLVEAGIITDKKKGS